MQVFFHAIALWVFHLGGIGLLLVGVADSSPLTMPLANDLLVIALSASDHARMPYYAAMAAVGSLLGSAITAMISRKAGEEVQERVAGRRVKFVESQIRKRAGWTLAVAAVVPPPFPFTPFVAIAAGLGYPRKKLLTMVGCARLARFLAEGVLAIIYGRSILALATSPLLHYSVIALMVIALAGSGYTIFRWIRLARQVPRGKDKTRARGQKTAHVT